MKYEFSDEENVVFSSLVNQVTILGVLVLTCGGLYLLLSLGHFRLNEGELRRLLPILVFAVAGVTSCVAVSAYLLDAARQFKLVVDTEGQDIQHVLTGLFRFSSMFRGGGVVLWVLSVVTVGLLIFHALFWGGANG